MITLSSGLYEGKMDNFFAGERNLVLNHPVMFKLGLILIVLGFLFQLISELVKVRHEYGCEKRK
jgi:hypothetical protein